LLWYLYNREENDLTVYILQALVESLQKGADQAERKYSEALKESEQRLKISEDQKSKIDQLQDSLQRFWNPFFLAICTIKFIQFFILDTCRWLWHIAKLDCFGSCVDAVLSELSVPILIMSFL